VKVTDLRHRCLEIPLRAAFGHARHARAASEPVIVRIDTDRGVSGYGEVQPRSYVTGETIASAALDVEAWRAAVTGASFASMAEVVAWITERIEAAGRRLAAFGGLELALLDAAGKVFGVDVADLVGPRRTTPLPQGMVIGFEVETNDLEKRCKILRGRYPHVKVKVGRNDDVDRLAIIARVMGDRPVRLDANMAFDAQGAIAAIERFRSTGLAVASIEQPVASRDLEGLRRVREETGMKVMVDESLVTYADGVEIIAAEAADIFNLRAGKNGGLLASKRLADLALSHGLEVHLGTMVGETGVLSRAGEILGERIAAFPCLEGKGQNRWLLAEDIVRDEPVNHGLGVCVTL
jgi:L-alanine-DL-glutamate epimerase-like enolase superfamily enzyme